MASSPPKRRVRQVRCTTWKALPISAVPPKAKIGPRCEPDEAGQNSKIQTEIERRKAELKRKPDADGESDHAPETGRDHRLADDRFI